MLYQKIKEGQSVIPTKFGVVITDSDDKFNLRFVVVSPFKTWGILTNPTTFRDYETLTAKLYMIHIRLTKLNKWWVVPLTWRVAAI